ncbi:MAG TPA: ribose 5-phosphate isomerase B [Blastocatellia bacterium]|nr:ribose 5-phosphate isomerase B [Blastocatellia bacterium]
MKIAIASDHAGYTEKEAIKQQLTQMGVEVEDYGTESADVSVDYPDFAERVGNAVVNGEAERGILVCGTGIGVSIAANKIPGVRAALAWNAETAQLARTHNDANILAVGARTTPPETIKEIVETYLSNEFAGGRHARRVEKIAELERK